MKKIKFILLGALSALLLSSCSLFNDNDIVVENHFKTKEEASQEKAPEATVEGVGSDDIKIGETEALVFKNIVYYNDEVDGVKKIKNTYTTDAAFKYDINGKEDYDVNPDNNNFDLYIPKGLNKADPQTIVLFIHGGAWVSGLKTHVNPYVQEFTKRGYISATIEYTLLNRDFANKRTDLSVFRDLDEIDACISTMKKCLEDLEFTGSLNLMIGGVSSGAHLTMLYAYSRGSSCAMPIKFITNAVGPTDIKEDVWKAFNYTESEQAAYQAALDEGIGKDEIATRKSEGKLRNLQISGSGDYWTQFQTMKIANGMCGFQFDPEVVEASYDSAHDKVDTSTAVYASMIGDTVSGEDLLSVTYYIKLSAKIPMICAYGGQDSIVGIAQYANLQKALEDKSYVKGTDYEYFYFKTSGHTNLDKAEEAENYNNFVNKIDSWLKA